MKDDFRKAIIAWLGDAYLENADEYIKTWKVYYGPKDVECLVEAIMKVEMEHKEDIHG